MQTMARPKKRAVGRPKNLGPKPTLVSLRGSEEYREWLEGLANRSHLPMAILLEHALREYAERHGYEKPQPRR